MPLETPRRRRACPLGADHRIPGPISPERQRAIRREAKKGRSIEWLASHFGTPPARVREALRTKKRTPKPAPAPDVAASTVPAE